MPSRWLHGVLVNPANYYQRTLYANLKFNFVRTSRDRSFNRVPNVMTVNRT